MTLRSPCISMCYKLKNEFYRVKNEFYRVKCFSKNEFYRVKNEFYRVKNEFVFLALVFLD